MRLLFIITLFSLAFPNTYAQKSDSIKGKHNRALRVVVAPVVLISAGLLTKDNNNVFDRFDVQDWRNENYSNFSNRADDVMQFLPIAVVYGLDIFKVKAKNDLLNRTLLLVKSEIVVNGLVHALKASTNVERPNGRNDHSFPSGHTAQAFCVATFMHKELGHKSVWYSIGAYTMASAVGVMRVLNNKHWISDVLVGAGIGTLSTNLIYATHRYKWGKRPGLVVLPTYSNGPGFYISLKVGS
jgi:membrane-associated phospholipid phosphatase